MLIWMLILELFVLVQAALSYCAGTCTEAQMLNQHLHGLPFIWQGAMWGDAFILSPLCAWVICRYGRQWPARKVGRAVGIGITISTILHLGYSSDNLNSAHIVHHQITAAGWVHVVYAAIAIAVLYLFFVCSNTNKEHEHAVYWSLAAFQCTNEIEPAWYLGQDILNTGTMTEIAGMGIAIIFLVLFKRRQRTKLGRA